MLCVCQAGHVIAIIFTSSLWLNINNYNHGFILLMAKCQRLQTWLYSTYGGTIMVNRTAIIKWLVDVQLSENYFYTRELPVA